MESYRKMEDVELVLRFFAYRQVEKLSSPIDQFLDTYLKKVNYFPDELLDILKNIFLETIDVLYAIFGNQAFVLPSKEKDILYKSPTKTVYDGMMLAFSKHIDKKEFIISKKEFIISNLYKDSSDLIYISDRDKEVNIFDGRYNNKKDVEKRFEYFDNFLKNIIL